MFLVDFASEETQSLGVGQRLGTIEAFEDLEGVFVEVDNIGEFAEQAVGGKT